MDAGEGFVAFARPAEPSGGLEVRVNFGVFAGREATPAEVDELARRLLDHVARVSIVCERRYEVSERVEASVHQVSVTLPPEEVPADVVAAARLEAVLVGLAETWAAACIADRRAAV